MVLPFEFWEEEKKEAEKRFKCLVDSLPYYARPQTDNERLFNLQKRYYTGEKEVINEMFIILNKIAVKLVTKESRSRKLFLSSIRVEEFGLDASCEMIEQIKKNNLMIQSSFIAYLRLQVLKVLFSQTLAQKFEKFCLVNHFDLFRLSEEEKLTIKKKFEEEMINEQETAVL